jgi:hypothetical protein
MVDLALPLRVVNISLDLFEKAAGEEVPLPSTCPACNVRLSAWRWCASCARDAPPSRHLLRLVCEAGQDIFYCHRTQLELISNFIGRQTARCLAA